MPQGVCEGVVRAIDSVTASLALWGAPIYVKHEIVHNKAVCDDLREKGAIFIEDLNDVPENSRVIFSAHGSPPSDFQLAKKRNLDVIDSSCPLVTKIHTYVKKASNEGAQIVIIGHSDHIEVKGVMGEINGEGYIVEEAKDIDKLQLDETKEIFYATQTTLSLLDVQELIDKLLQKYPKAKTIPSGSICFATTNRQTALNECIPQSDYVIVVGDPMSSNAVKLMDLGLKKGKKSYLIRNKDDIPYNDILNDRSIKICLTSGASTPSWLVDQIIEDMKTHANVSQKFIYTVDENLQWKLPKQVQDEIYKRKKNNTFSIISVNGKRFI